MLGAISPIVRVLAIVSFLPIVIVGCSKGTDTPAPYQDAGQTGGAPKGGALSAGGATGGRAPTNNGGGTLGYSPNTRCDDGLAGAVGALGGAAQGGAAQGGSIGTGGDIGSGGVPATCTASPTCDKYCKSMAQAASCATPYEKCVCNCETFAPACANAFAAVFQCADATPPAVLECLSTPAYKGCEQSSLNLQKCEADQSGRLCAKSLPQCGSYCDGLVLSGCDNSPYGVTSCLCDCENRVVPKCSGELSAYDQCRKGTLTYTCDTLGALLPSTCQTEWASLLSCQNGTF